MHWDEKTKNESSCFVCVNRKARVEGQRRVFDLPSKRDTRKWLWRIESTQSKEKDWLDRVKNFGSKRYIPPKLGGMCWRRFLTRIKIDDEAEKDCWSGRSRRAWRRSRPIFPLLMGQGNIPVWKVPMRMEISRWRHCWWAEEAADLEGDGVSDTGIDRWYCCWQGFCWPVE